MKSLQNEQNQHDGQLFETDFAYLLVALGLIISVTFVIVVVVAFRKGIFKKSGVKSKIFEDGTRTFIPFRVDLMRVEDYKKDEHVETEIWNPAKTPVISDQRY